MSQEPIATFYDMLEIARDVPQAEIEPAFQRLWEHYNPEKLSANDPNRHRRMKLRRAFDTLNDPERRADYDRVLSSNFQKILQTQFPEIPAISNAAAAIHSHPEHILQAFPHRTFRVRAMPLSIGKLVIALLGLAWCVMWLALLGPNVRDTWSIARDPVTIAEAEMTGWCKTRWLLLTHCVIDIQWNEAVPRRVHREFSFVGTKADAVAAVRARGVVRARNNPDLVTAGLAVDHQLFDILVLLFLAGMGAIFPLGVGAVWLIDPRRGLGKQRVEVEPLLLPVQLRLPDHPEAAETWSGATVLDGRRCVALSDELPFFVNRARNLALAVRFETKRSGILILDEQLTTLDFTDDERRQLRLARTAVIQAS